MLNFFFFHPQLCFVVNRRGAPGHLRGPAADSFDAALTLLEPDFLGELSSSAVRYLADQRAPISFSA
jgi:hypothetical protein